MINKRICPSRKFNALKDDSARLTYLLLLPFTYPNGTTEGDACYVRSRVYPRRSDVTEEVVASHLDDMESAGLIIQYEHEGDPVIYFTKFVENQAGLRADREPPSPFPLPPPEMKTAQQEGAKKEDETMLEAGGGTLPAKRRQDAGKMPAKCRQDAAPLSPEVEVEEEVEEDPPPTPPRGRGVNVDWVDDPEWREVFRDWAENKKVRYKNPRGLKAGYQHLVRLSSGDIAVAREIVERSLANGWQGLFPLARGQPPQATVADFEHRIE